MFNNFTKFLLSALLISSCTMNPDKKIMKVERFTLDNGMRVYFTQNQQTPEIMAEIIVRVGSKNEPLNATGLAHYLEHLMFKGSDKLGTVDFKNEKILYNQIVALYTKKYHTTNKDKREQITKQINKLSLQAAKYEILGEYDNLYQTIGGTRLNAHTSEDETAYHVIIPKNQLEKWAKIESNRFTTPIFRLFQWELETVYEESNRDYDSPSSSIYYETKKSLYGNHPYGRKILGKIEHLKNPSLQKVIDFYNTYYVPNNMAIIISGDTTLSEVKKLTTKYFSKLQNKAIPQYKNINITPPTKRIFKKVKFRSEPMVMIGFLTNSNISDDASALFMLDMILDNSQAGLINLNLNKGQKVKQAGSFPSMGVDHGIQFLSGTPKKGQTLKEVEELLLKQIEIIKKGDFDEKLLIAIVNDFKRTYIQGLEGNSKRVSFIRSNFIQNIPWKESENYLVKLAKVTKADILRVANKYFSKGYAVTNRVPGTPILPKIKKPSISPLKSNNKQNSDFFNTITSMKTNTIEPKFVKPNKDYTIDNISEGTTLFYIENPINNIAEVSFIFNYGNFHDKNSCFYINMLGLAGTKKFDRNALSSKMYSLGIQYEFSCSTEAIGFSLQGLEENFDQAIPLMFSLFENPQIDQKSFESYKEISLLERKNNLKNARTINSALKEKLLLKNNSSYIHQPNNKELSKLPLEGYKNIYKNIKHAKRKVFYIGQKNFESTKQTVIKYLPDFDNSVVFPERPLLSFINSKKPTIYFYHLPAMAQANIQLLYGDKKFTYSNRDYFIESAFLDTYLSGGMGSVIFQEIREKRALAYDTWTYYQFGKKEGDQNIFRGYLGTQADKTVEAIKTLHNILDNIPLSKARFEITKKSMINSFTTKRLTFRTLPQYLDKWFENNLIENPRPKLFETAKNMNFSKLKNYAITRIQKRPFSFILLADKEKINLRALKSKYTIKYLSKNDIFNH